MLKVGVTGGIGAGKTTVCRIFEQIGIPVYYSDLEARKLMISNELIIGSLKNLFGSDIYINEGNIDRKKLAGIIFKDKLALHKVNSIVHPEVRKHFATWAEQQNSLYVIQESAILFESNLNKLFDKIIMVTAPFEMKIERVVKRDRVNREKVIERINNQIDDSEKILSSDFVINTDGTRPIESQLFEIHKKILNL